MTPRARLEIRVAAVAGPIVVAVAASLLREVLANTSAALVLVLVVVAVGVAGDRVAGVLAALSAAAAFDYFHLSGGDTTPPDVTSTVDGTADVNDYTATVVFKGTLTTAFIDSLDFTGDIEFAGCPMRKGDRVVLSEISAGHDEAAFPDADQFVVDRLPNRHLSFGMGIHRCPGAHLARIEFTEILDAVFTRMPDFEIDLDAVVEYPNWSVIGGWGRMPAVFTPGGRS